MLKKINIKNASKFPYEYFQYSPVGEMNDHTLSIYQAENRKTEFHVHENADEMFFCIEGEFDIETEDGLNHLSEGDFVIVPRGTAHRPVVKSHMRCLLIEADNATIRSPRAKKEKFRFRHAKESEADAVYEMYREAAESPYCTWDDDYPDYLEIENDLSGKNLFVLEENGELIGAISIVTYNELDIHNVWSSKEAAEFARVVIRPDHQGKGLAKQLVNGVLDELRGRGIHDVHIAAARENLPAQKLYERLGFKNVGWAAMYQNVFNLYEKSI